MSTTKSSLHNCSSCEPGAKDSDCASCKLAFLSEAKKKAEQKERQRKSLDDDDYSISERLTEEGNDHTILYLFIIAALTFALVVLFTKIMN